MHQFEFPNSTPNQIRNSKTARQHGDQEQHGIQNQTQKLKWEKKAHLALQEPWL